MANQKPMVGVRVEESLKREMDKLDINWSSYLRKCIKEKVNYPKAPREIRKLVEKYQTRPDITKLWILHIFSEVRYKTYIYDTADLILGGDRDKIVDEVESDLKNRGISDMYKRLDNGFSTSKNIQAVISESGGTGNIRNIVKNRIKKLEKEEVKEGVWLLTCFLGEKLNDVTASIKIKGFRRTWSILSEKEVNIEELVSIGLLYKDHYSSNAYSYWSYRVPSYSLSILKEVVENPSKFDIDLPTKGNIENKRGKVREERGEILKWMKTNEFVMYVPTYREKEKIVEDLKTEEINLDWEKFKIQRDKLIKQGVLVIDYSPDRSRTGRRSSKPAKWIYRLTRFV